MSAGGILIVQIQPAEGFPHTLLWAIVDREAITPEDRPLLSNSIDIDALEQFLHSRKNEVNAEFNYLGWTIAVRNDGHFTITETHYE